MNRLVKMCKSAPTPLLLLISFVLAAACVPVGGPADPGVNVYVQPHLRSPHPCEDRFVARTLDHITSIEGEVVRTYDSNGAGLAVNDLDRDGDLDLVLANLAGPNAIFWNQGDLRFLKQDSPTVSRAASASSTSTATAGSISPSPTARPAHSSG